MKPEGDPSPRDPTAGLGPDGELTVLKLLLRKVAEGGNVSDARRAIEILCRTIDVRCPAGAVEGLARSLMCILNEWEVDHAG